MIKALKSLGQNFLTDQSVAQKMTDALELVSTDTVVEIGPGLGSLTSLLVKKYDAATYQVYAVELDKRVIENLKNLCIGNFNVEIIEANILDWLPGFKTEKPFKIIGSLPFYITSPILHAVVKMEKHPEVCVFMVQKEVAEKIAATAPDSSYLSVIVQTFFDVIYMGKVDRKKFDPQPDVDGGIIKLKRKANVTIDREIMRKYEGFLHRGFASPRKMLNKVFSKEELAKADINGQARPQDLPASKWLEVYKILYES